MQKRDAKKRKWDDIFCDELIKNNDVQFMEEEVPSEDFVYATPLFDDFSECSTSTQTDTLPMMYVDVFCR